MGTRYYLNDNWKFCEEYSEEMVKAAYDESWMKEVRIPHTCKELPYHYFDESEYQMLCGYRKKVMISEEWAGKNIFLSFEGVAHDCEVFVNEKKAGEHHCGYTAFTIDITDFVQFGVENLITVKVDSRESLNIPPFGNVIDYMTYGGIYRDVYIEVKEKQYIKDIFLHADISNISDIEGCDTDLSGLENGKVLTWQTGEVMLHSQVQLNAKDAEFKIRQIIKPYKTDAFSMHINEKLPKIWEGIFPIPMQKEQKSKPDIVVKPKKKTVTFDLQWKLKNIVLWDIEHPALYEITTQLFHENEVMDETTVIFGFRKAEFKKDGFYLNENKVRIRGLNRHQSYPYVGYAMPASMQKNDADILKKELGLNAVRTSHYPQSQDFIQRCNELGLMVFTELPGWQHIGDEEWKSRAVENVKEMVLQYRNHPSIILWGVRINESVDDDEFYARTNKAAKKLDPYRATGGVRRHKKSSLLEDVYTYNDFVHSGKNKGCEPKANITSDTEKPYLVTEYNGHMYPTKAFDWEEHRTEHALRHARVLDAVAGEKDIAGSFGWCMADYNTHKDFGSGDRICYHGVLDMFRNPKMAADVYASQQEERNVLSLSTSLDIGEHPASSRGKNWIFTNADSVRMYKNDRLIKEYKKEDSFCRNLSHGPILIDDFIGDSVEKEERFDAKTAKELTQALNSFALYGMNNLPPKTLATAAKMMVVHGMTMSEMEAVYTKHVGDWGGTSTAYRFEAVKDGEVTATVVKQPMKKMQLVAKVDHVQLIEGKSYDVAAVRIQMQDENGNLLNFCNEPLSLSVEGPIEFIGDSLISCKGGMTGTYVKTKGMAGKAALMIHSAQAGDVRIEFEVAVDEEIMKL